MLIHSKTVLSDSSMPAQETQWWAPRQSAPGGLPNLRSENQEIRTHVLCGPLGPWQSNERPQVSSGNEESLPGETGREGFGERAAKPRLRGEHNTFQCIQDDWGGAGTKSVQDTGARKHWALWAWKGCFTLSSK